MSLTPSEQILVPTAILSQLLHACLASPHLIKEMVATLDLPDLPSLSKNPNPLKVLIDVYKTYADNNFINQTPVTVYFFMENDETVYLSSCHVEIAGAIEHYKNSISDGSIPKSWKIAKAQVIFEEGFFHTLNEDNLEETLISEEVQKEPLSRNDVIAQLVENSIFYKTDKETTRIVCSEKEKGFFHTLNEDNLEENIVYIENVKDSDIFIRPNPVTVADYLKSRA